MFAVAFAVAVLGACAPEGDGSAVTAIVDPSRSEHYFDVPFPSDDLLDPSGFVDLSGYPGAETAVEAVGAVVDGWMERIELTTQGFGNNSSAYFRFDGPLDLPTETEGLPTDPVVWVAMDGSEILPLVVRFVEDPKEDPFYAPNTLAMAPALGHPPQSGQTYAAVVMDSAGVTAPEGYVLPDGVEDAVFRAGLVGLPVVATVFTVQDVTGQMKALMADADSRLGDSPDWGDVNLRRVTELTYTQGLTDSGEEATLCIATFEDGETDTTYLYANEEGEHTVDLMDWPMAVYQGTMPVLNYSGLDDQPYMSPGLTHLFDTDRHSGWIQFSDGVLTEEPDADSTRIVVSLPLDEGGEPIDNAPVLVYDHGTGGHAYNAIQRISMHDDGYTLAQRYTDAGWAVIGRDAPLYGQRYPLIDEGYSGGSLGYYNVVNLPAFRDNERQTAVEGHILRRFILDGLNDALPAGSVDGSRIRRFGHSLGSVTSNLQLAADSEAWEAAFHSGTGGLYSHYFLDTGLLDTFGGDTMDTLFDLFDATAPDEITTEAVLGAALGLGEESWDHLDRMHPALTLFQWTMDPGDPMSIARDTETPITILLAVGDWQVPNFTTEGLAEAQPGATVVECVPAWEYDPHYCFHREEQGFDAMTDWLAQ